MKRLFAILITALAVLVIALLARPHSPGAQWTGTVKNYLKALEEGRGQEALDMLCPELAVELSEDFLLRLLEEEVPSQLSWNGSDSRGIRIAGETQETGARVVWLAPSDGELFIAGDTSLDKLLGTAVLLCRENAITDPDGCCPVSGVPYTTDETGELVICSSGHLGGGLAVGQGRCAERRDSVLAELNDYLASGYELPSTLEEMYTLSGGETGRRGGYSCPDNGYKYYEIRDGAVYCPFHERSSLPAEMK